MTTKPRDLDAEIGAVGHEEAEQLALCLIDKAFNNPEKPGRRWQTSIPVSASDTDVRLMAYIRQQKARGASSVASAGDGREAIALEGARDVIDELQGYGVAIDPARRELIADCDAQLLKCQFLDAATLEPAAKPVESSGGDGREVADPLDACGWALVLQDNIRAAAKAVLMACGVEDHVEAEAEQLRVAALRCRDLGYALRKAVDAMEAAKPVESLAGWAVRCLDAWAKKNSGWWTCQHRGLSNEVSICDIEDQSDDPRQRFEGETDSAARISAARALYAADNSLPAPPEDEAK